MPLLVLLYAGLIVYGSLYPFAPWGEPDQPLFSFLHAGWPRTPARADLIQNVLVYVPLGILVVAWLNGSMRFTLALVIATAAGGALSLTMESIQQFIPARIASIADVTINVSGTLLGGMLAGLLAQDTFVGLKIKRLRETWLQTGRMPSLGLAILALWALSQTSPLVPSLDIGHLRHGLSMLYRTLQNPQNFRLEQAGIYFSYTTGLGLLAFTIGRPGKPMVVPYTALVTFVLACKIFVVGRQLSLEALTGASVAIFMLLLLPRMPSKPSAVTAMVFIGAGFTLYELAAAPGAASIFYSFNWMPLAGQMSSIKGFENILEILWPFLALGYFARYLSPPWRATEYAIVGGVTILSALFLMEWWQRFLPGRVGDITQVLIGVSGWALAWWVGNEKYSDEQTA